MKKVISIILFVVILQTSIISFASNIDVNISEGMILTEEEAKQLIDDINNGRKRLEIPKDEDVMTLEETDGGEAFHRLMEEDMESSISLLSDDLISEQSTDSTGWISCAIMTSARSNMASAVIGNKIYVFGGTESGTVVRKNEVFDTETNLWSVNTSMNAGRYKHSAITYGNNVYICSGYGEYNNSIHTISVYDTINDTWLADIDTPNCNTNYASGLYNNELYIFGGKENGEVTQKAYKYNFLSGLWTEISQIPENSLDEKVVPTQNGFYIFADWDVIEYNVSTNSYSIVDHIPREVEEYAVAVRDIYENGTVSKNDAIYITGGHDSDSDVSTGSVKAWYVGDNTSSREWFNDLRLIRGLSSHNMAIVNGYIYVYGGQVVQGTDQRIMFKRSLYENPDDVISPQTINENTYTYGSINYYGDSDTFLFTPSTDGKYAISQSTAIHSNNSQYQWHVEISEYNTGKKVSYCYRPEILSGIELTAGTTYAIKISDERHYATGNYMFKVSQYSGDDVADCADDAQIIDTDVTYNRTFSGVQDRDFYKINVDNDGDYKIDLQTDMYAYGYKMQIGTQFVTQYIYYPYNNISVILYNNEKKEFARYMLPLSYTGFGASPETVIHLNKGNYYISIEPEEYDFENHNEHGIDGLYYNDEHNTYSIEISTKQVYNNEPLYPRMQHNLVSANNKLYAVGGYNDDFDIIENIESYNPHYRAWEHETDINIPNTLNYPNEGYSSVIIGNKIYNIGGYLDYTYGSTDYIYFNDVNAYDINTMQWANVGSFSNERERAGVAVNNNQIYIVGGRNNDGFLSSVEVYNVATNTSSTTAELPQKLMDVQAFFYNDTLYAVGGIGYEGYSDRVYALENGSWVQKNSMPYKSSYVRGKSYNDSFFAASVNDNGNVDILKYDILLDKWSVLYNDFIVSRTYFGLEILNGMLYITGGYSESEDVVKNDVHIYDIVTDIESMDTAIPVRTMGFEYEQSINNDTITSPEILGINAKIIDSNKGIYELYLNEDDYNCDVRSIPFFFWSAREGMFSALSDDYRRVLFYADPDTGDRKIKIIVGIGDSRGYVDRKAILLDGNKTGGENE